MLKTASIGYIFLLSCVLPVFISGCKKERISGDLRTDAAMAENLRLASDTIQADNSKLVITVRLWRDFMPAVPQVEDGSGLYCNVVLTDINKVNIPARLTVMKIYVVNGNELWSIQANNPIYQAAFSIEINESNGPKWATGSRVDVICEFELTGQLYRVIARQQQIQLYS